MPLLAKRQARPVVVARNSTLLTDDDEQIMEAKVVSLLTHRAMYNRPRIVPMVKRVLSTPVAEPGHRA
jgi:hypothetical protein